MKWRNVTKTAGEVLSLLEPGITVCVFDTETTGLSENDRIIQFSAIRLRVLKGYRFEELDFLDLYINPKVPLPPKIVEITGITDDLLSFSADEEELAPDIFRYLASADVWVAYNTPFDMKMLKGMSRRTGISLMEKSVLDVLEFSRDWLKKGEDVENHKLGTIYSFLYPDGDIRFHKAIEDVRATIKVMEALIPKYIEVICRDDDAPKKEYHIEKAYAWINPHNQKQQRICLRLTDGNITSSGDVFYDYVDKCWSHKATAQAKRLFESLNLADVEERVLQMCSNRYDTFTNMDQLAKKRLTWLRNKMK